jgi:hypothetical protein
MEVGQVDPLFCGMTAEWSAHLTKVGLSHAVLLQPCDDSAPFIEKGAEGAVGKYTRPPETLLNKYNRAVVARQVLFHREAIWAGTRSVSLLLAPSWGDPADRWREALRQILLKDDLIFGTTIAVVLPGSANEGAPDELVAIAEHAGIDLLGIPVPSDLLEWLGLLSGANIFLETVPCQEMLYFALCLGYTLPETQCSDQGD